MNIAKWSITLLMSLMTFSWYFYNLNSSVHIQMDSRVLDSTIDTIVTDLSVRQFNTEGQLIHVLTTPLLQHIPASNKHLLKEPLITVQEPNQGSWEIHAREATALNGGKQISFNKQVIVHQHKFNQTEPTTLMSEEIIYFPQEKLAVSTKEVTFRQVNNHIKSTGMKAYLAENRVELLQHAQAHYEPQNG